MTNNDSKHRAALWALLLGNFIIGVGVLMPAGLINELTHAFALDPAHTAKLMSYGAAVLFFEAPLLAFLTNKLDRRTLLVGSLVLYAVGHIASAYATSFNALLVSRLVMIGGAAAFTPQAASAVALFMPVEQRVTSVAFIFLGWSAASAVGVPLAAAIGAFASWSTAYLLLGVLAALAAVYVHATVPAPLFAPRMSREAWAAVFLSGRILSILSVTMIFIAGQFTVYPFIAVALKEILGASSQTIPIWFFAYGVAGVVSSTISARLIGRLGASFTVNVHLLVVMCGLLLWLLATTLSNTVIPAIASLSLAALGLTVWGYGGSPTVSGQQARLIGANPAVASASVALNTSVLYAGQAMGTELGGVLLRHQYLRWSGAFGIALLVLALGVSWFIHRRHQS
jgi:predicted MFS family arabinose efflux permease